MRAEGQGWVLFQPGDDENEAVTLEIEYDWAHRIYAGKSFTQPEAQKLYAALGDALGNMTPEEKQ